MWPAGSTSTGTRRSATRGSTSSSETEHHAGSIDSGVSLFWRSPGETHRGGWSGGATNRIAQAVERLRSDFDRAIRIEDLARSLGMSVSSFHQHVKEVTAMSPLEFQKQLRLQEARRLMLGENLDATSAGYRVGYNDASHFNREYKRLFGEPPMRDIEQLRGVVTETTGV